MFRALGPADQCLLVTATLLNLNWCAERFTERDVRTDPSFHHYCELRPACGDHGVVAEVEGDPVGVVWLLLLGAEDPGFGFVAEGVPELSVCVLPGWRRRGLGGELLRRGLAAARQRGQTRVSLSVEAGNPAGDLYRGLGFRAAGGTHDPGTLVLDLCPDQD